MEYISYFWGCQEKICKDADEAEDGRGTPALHTINGIWMSLFHIHGQDAHATGGGRV
jgi:hypothetical protein